MAEAQQELAAHLDPFFDQGLAAFERAASAGPGITQTHSVAGQPVRIHYAHQALAASFGPALPAAIAAERPRLSIYAWGGELPGGLLPPPDWEAVGYFERGNVRGHHSPRYTLAYDRKPEVFSAFDAQRQLGLYWARDSGGLLYYEQAAPMRRLLQGWLQRRGLLALHAAGVSTSAGGALLAGRTGAGKSTTAVACARAGLGYAGDDYVLVAPGAAPRLYGLYRTAKLNPSVLGWMPELAAQVSNGDRLSLEKALIYWPGPGLGEDGAPLRAIFLLRHTTQSETQARQLPGEAAFRAILPDTLFSLLGEARQVTSALRPVVHTVPCFDLALGTDLDGVAAVIAEVLSTAGDRV